jgi:hypothetical protein
MIMRQMRAGYSPERAGAIRRMISATSTATRHRPERQQCGTLWKLADAAVETWHQSW